MHAMNKFLQATLQFLLVFTTCATYAQNFPTAQEVANEMTIGWNIGNTMESFYINNGQIVAGETSWGNPMISQTLIDGVKAAGFNTIRIPISWDIHSTNGTIDPAWLARVKEVVDYCYNQDLYVIINIHWDNGWLEENCTLAMKDINNAKQASYWNQIANYFKSYDEHLLFASANEPHVADATEMSVLLSYHQTFINTVRATGGNNSQRILIVQGPATDIEKTNNLMNTMPTDPASGRLMAEVHFYPYQFSLMQADEGWGNQFYYWGACNHSTTDAAHNPTWGEEAWVDEMFQLMKSKFVDQGYPVLLGEFGVRKRTELSGDAYNLHIQSREYFHKYVVKSALNHGLIPVYWCAGLGELFNRNTGAVLEPGTVNALMAGAYSASSSVNCGQNDCQGTAKGHAYTNECNNCVLGYEAACYTEPMDCNGVAGGSAYYDNCNTCVGGNTGKEACTQDCEGNWGGTSYEDNCGVCISATNGNQECSGSMEAEEACSVDGIKLESTNAGYSGDGYVNTDNLIGASATWTLYSNTAQTATISFRYANGGSTARDGNILVNGNPAGYLKLAATGAWSNWKMATAQLNLIQGSNEISLSAVSADGLANIDLISYSGGVDQGVCVITGINDSKNTGIKLYPNPTQGKVELSTPSDWKLMNSMGTVLDSEVNSKKVDLSSYPAGIYYLMVDGVSYKVVKK